MSRIEKQDTQGTKPLLSTGELGYDNYPAGGDVGRVYVGTGTENIGLAKKTEVMAVDGKADTHIARVDNPHSVTKAQVGLGNADNTADVDKSVLSATKLTTPRNITISGEVAGSVSFDGSTDINISTTIQPNSVALGTDTTGNYVDSVIAGEGITVTGVVGEGGTPSIAIAPVGTSGTYTKVSTNDKGQVVSGELLTANDIPNLDASKITSGIIDAARLPASAGNIPEYATLSEFPIVGDSGKVCIALDTNKMYRWSGSTYVSIAGGVDSVAGKTGVVILAKADVGLNDVDNTSDINKPISTATQNALNNKANISYVNALPGVGAKGNQDTTGNADTATRLQTARTIGGVSFDGTANINLPGVNTAGNQSTTGNAGSASKLETARTINGVAFDGTANITIADNTKAPLNGTGASGTWGINITGNAATATNASTLNGYSGAHYLLQNDWDNPPGKDANLQEDMRVDFTYSNNAPFTGPLMNVGVSNYSMQFNSEYNGNSNLAYRTKNGDDNTWNAWRYIAFTNSNITGNADSATRLSTDRGNYKTITDSNVVGQLMWKNYGNGHTIFDASNSTTPTGTAINNTNPDNAWAPTYPTLMGFNGNSTYGVRVDSSRYADSATNAGYASTAGRAYPRRSDGADLNFYWSGQGGQPTWLWGGHDGTNMYVYNPSNFSVNYANSAGSVSASAVASGTAGIGVGGVGGYAFAILAGGNDVAVGENTAGSNLRYACVSGSYAQNSSTIVPSGTWRCMGRGSRDYLTLWLRIA